MPAVDDDIVTYQRLAGTTKRGNDSLVDSHGYQYTEKIDKRRANTTWRCSLRNKNVTCKATVLEKNGEFIRGVHEHICGVIPGREKVALLRRDVKVKAMENPFDSAAEIVEKLIRDDIGIIRQLMSLPIIPLEHVQAAFRHLEESTGDVLETY
ncbi:uncharacterized protein [Antedon mediterranea]|uniref:uncharacterized protein n=1 Tax=Antedon mediterranea TaxID=105859 RepID=UPI003AF4290A